MSMDKKKKNGLVNLTMKATAIFGAAMAALTGIQPSAPINSEQANLDGRTVQLNEIAKKKPMPLLKLNIHNPENSHFVANHTSHRSHSSHRSHYSHRSGAMFA